MQTPSPAPIEYVSYLKRALIYGQITEKDFYPFSLLPSGRSFLSSTVKGTQTLIDQTYRAWTYGQMSSAIVQNPSLLSKNDSFGGPAPSDFVDDLRRSLLYGGLTYSDLGGFYIAPFGATFWRDFIGFPTLNHGVGIPLACTRPGPASYIGSDGQMKIAQVNEPRFDHDPVTLERKGLLCEISRKNFVVQSAVGVSQTIPTLTSGIYTLSFYGTGVLSFNQFVGTGIPGSGAFPTRTVFTFTATTLVVPFAVTVTGNVQYMQIESGAFATSWIPTGAPGTADTRAEDFIESATDGLPSSVFNYTQGTLYASFNRYTVSQRAGFLDIKSDQINTFSLRTQTAGNVAKHELNKRPGNRGQETVCRNLTNATVNTVYKLAGAYNNDTSDYRLFENGLNVGTIITQNNLLPENLYRVQVGRTAADAAVHGWLREVAYMPKALTNDQLTYLTS